VVKNIPDTYQIARPSYILSLIVVSQFAGTSLWFVVNAVGTDIFPGAHTGLIGEVTSIIQFGFISGTLVFAFLSIADRFSPSRVFFYSSLLAALANLAIIWAPKEIYILYSLRFITGFFLAGIYPVGMKIASDWYEKGLGKAMGFLVGALVLGTAFPNLLKLQLFQLHWKGILLFTSAFAAMGGLLILLFVGDGPYRKVTSRFHPAAIIKIFGSNDFRAASFGYFGHMWELYTFWSLVPIILSLFNTHHQLSMSVYGWSFIIIAIGSLSCIAGGYLSEKIGSSWVAFISLACSGLCCLLTFYFHQLPVVAFYFLMIMWGITVISDSPQFSTLVAQTAPPEYKGTALTFVTCIGFSITILSIQLITYLLDQFNNNYVVLALLAPGPIAGLFFLWPLASAKKTEAL
jgi:MFS family permease